MKKSLMGDEQTPRQEEKLFCESINEKALEKANP